MDKVILDEFDRLLNNINQAVKELEEFCKKNNLTTSEQFDRIKANDSRRAS